LFLDQQEDALRTRTPRTLRTWHVALGALLALLTLFAAACGGDDSSSGASTNPTTTAPKAAASTFPVTVTGSNGAVTISAKPARIVSLSASSTEDLFAIDAGKQVVAVDDQSNYPAGVPKTTLSGFNPNVEAIAKYEPDLVVMSDASVAKQLKAIKVPLLVLSAPSNLDGAYAQITTLGKATGHETDADALVAKMKLDITNITKSTPRPTTPLTYYHELDNTYYTVTSKTFIGNVYGLLGLKNIADPADKNSGGYPQLSAEFIVSTSPDIIFLADTKCCKQSATTVAARAGWNQITAVKNGNVVNLDDDIASRWGPRVVDLLREAAGAVKHAESSG
jgi:iron complex transport system substrate-binding protein